MLKLRGKVEVINPTKENPSLVFLTRNQDLALPLRKRTALLIKSSDLENFYLKSIDELTSFSFASILFCGQPLELEKIAQIAVRLNDVYYLPEDYSYLDEGDIVRLNPAGSTISAVFRKNAPNNSILLTERCNHLCLMCSQPPKDVDDSWLLDEAFELVRMIPMDTVNIGFTGGEPTTYGEKFIELVNATKLALPNTSLDILTNGRRFKNEAFAARLGRVKHPNLQLGIPIYSDDPVRHDYVVQAKGAFDETIQGILNLKQHGVRVEVRVVIHQQTLPRLVNLAEFIARNLLFVDHVALMGMEITGFTRANLEILWVDPESYREKLSDAVEVLRSYGMNCSVYNHQLCLVNKDVEPAYKKSISDWKNEYLPVCDECVRKSECGGFFSTQIMFKHSDHISPFILKNGIPVLRRSEVPSVN